MRAIPLRQRATLARRVATGLPVWAAARGSNLPAEDVGEIMWENEFRELIGAATCEKFAGLPPDRLAMMVEQASPDMAKYLAVLWREADEGKLWPQGP